MDQTTLSFIISCGGALLTAGISWGIMQSTGKSNASETVKLWKELADLKDDLDEVKDKFVPLEYFKQIVGHQQVQLTEIQKDIKAILKNTRQNG